MEAFEAGKLTTEHTDGIKIRFGDAETMVQLTEMIAQREGFGDILAEGSEHAAEKLGLGAEFLITSKGQEAAAHMPQMKSAMALIYAVNPFGSDHMSCDHDFTYTADTYETFKDRYGLIGLSSPVPARSLESDKVEFVCKTQHLYSMMDSLNMCQFVWGGSWQLYGPEQMVQMIQAVTGWDVTIQELMTVGERRLNLMRQFNAREGFDHNQDTLPEKFLARGLEGGPTKGWKVDRDAFQTALKEYYRQCQWDQETGNPTSETLNRLGVSWSTES
jgi:aldehyde:ferredoxin oxidoreductase